MDSKDFSYQKQIRTLQNIALIFLLIFSFILFFHKIKSINQDLGRHLKIGEIITLEKQIPKTNLFSYTNPDFPFINHHWLPEVLFYVLVKNFGFNSLVVFKTIMNLLAFLLLFIPCWKKFSKTVVLVVGFLTLLILVQRTEIRPEIFSYLFTSIYLFFLFFKRNYRFFWILILIQILWVNSHIYFFIGPALLFFYFLAGLLEKKAVGQRIFYFILAGLACLINPNFLKGALYPFFVLKNYGYQIIENQSPFFMSHYTGQLYLPFFWLSFFILLLTIILNFQKHRLFPIFTAIFFITLTFKSIRSAPFFGLAFLPIGALNLEAMQKKFLQKSSSELKTNASLLILIILIAIISFSSYQMAKVKQFGFGMETGANKAVDFLLEKNISGPIFNNFDIGGYLIYRLYPQYKVFVDNRPEAYPASFFQNIYIPAQQDNQQWENLDQKYNFNIIFFSHTDITQWAQIFLKRISQDKNWEQIYFDKTAIIFKRKVV